MSPKAECGKSAGGSSRKLRSSKCESMIVRAAFYTCSKVSKLFRSGSKVNWRCGGPLKAVADLSADLACSDYERLMKRAIEQRSRAEALRLQSAITALRPT